jgi:hypothetical protein
VPFVLFRKKNFIYFIFFAKTCPERDKSGPGDHDETIVSWPGLLVTNPAGTPGKNSGDACAVDCPKPTGHM